MQGACSAAVPTHGPHACMRMLAGVAAKRQIFNPREAFTQLANELVALMRISAETMEMLVDSDGDDVYRWVVELPVDPETPLGKVCVRGTAPGQATAHPPATLMWDAMSHCMWGTIIQAAVVCGTAAFGKGARLWVHTGFLPPSLGVAGSARCDARAG